MHRPRRREVLAGIWGVGSLTASSVLGPDGLLTSSPALETAALDGTWPQYGHDPRRSRYAPDATGPTTELTEQWQTDLDRPPEWGRVHAIGPLVDQRHVYAMETDELVALDRESGREQWRFRPPTVTAPVSVRNGEVSSPGDTDARFAIGEWVACRDGRVFVEGVGTDRTDRVLYAVDAESGTKEWAMPGVTGVALLGDVLLCHLSIDEPSHALVDAASGRIHERFDARVSFEPACFVGQGLSAGTNQFDVRSDEIDPSGTDSEIAVLGPGTRPPAITSSGLALSSPDFNSDEFVVFDLQRGRSQRLARFETPTSRVATDDERWYVAAHDAVAAYRVREPDGSDPVVEWQTDIPEEVGKLAVTDTALYVPTAEGIFVLDPGSGDILAEQGPGVEVTHWDHPAVVAGETLYRRLSDGTLYAYK